MAKGSGSDAGDFKVVKLKVYSKRRSFVFFVSIALSSLFTFFIFSFVSKGNLSWVTIVMPVSFLGFLTVFIPPVEEWSYAPWQDASQKYEKNIYD